MLLPTRWRIAFGAAAAYVLAAAAAGIFLAEGTVRLPRTPVSDLDRAGAARAAAARSATLEDEAIAAADGTRLRGWLFTPAGPLSGAVLVLHGQGNNRAGMMPYTEMLLDAGFAVLAPDARGHGASDGALASYGAVEADDVHRWAALLRSRAGGRCVFGFAESMGAGTLLQSIGGNSGFCAVIADSPFASFREVAFDRIAGALGIPPWLARTAFWPVVESGLLYVRVRYGIDLGRANPQDVMRTSTVPVLLIHGSVDRSIPPRHSQMLAAARPAATTIWEVPGAGHCGAISTAPDEFSRRVLAFFGVAPPRSSLHAEPLAQ